MTWDEKLRLLWLAATLFFIIGGYWLLRSLKDPVISTICAVPGRRIALDATAGGVQYIPKAKMLSVVVVTVLVFIYNKLIDMFPKHQLFYIVGGFYAALFTSIALLLAMCGRAFPQFLARRSHLRRPSTTSTSIYNTDPSPYRLLGWVSYCSIESFGSIGVSLFWAFTNSTYNLEGAKKSYGLMVACAQYVCSCTLRLRVELFSRLQAWLDRWPNACQRGHRDIRHSDDVFLRCTVHAHDGRLDLGVYGPIRNKLRVGWVGR